MSASRAGTHHTIKIGPGLWHGESRQTLHSCRAWHIRSQAMATATIGTLAPCIETTQLVHCSSMGLWSWKLVKSYQSVKGSYMIPTFTSHTLDSKKECNKFLRNYHIILHHLYLPRVAATILENIEIPPWKKNNIIYLHIYIYIIFYNYIIIYKYEHLSTVYM